MPFENVHVMEMDRATSRLELTKINPTREFLMGTSTGMARYAWQNGSWYGTGGDPIKPEDVPQQFRDEITANPVTVATTGAPTVAAACRLCGQQMNTSEMEEHLLRHVDETMKQAGTLQASAEAIPPALPDERGKPERRPRPEA